MQTRRQFVTAASSAAAAVILAPEALANGNGGASGLARGGRFREGVMSGQPTTRGISLWTRVDGLEGRARVELEVARDRSFRNVVARRRISTSDALNHNVKARVSGLRPHEQYYYRFSTATEDGPGRALPDRAARGLAPARALRLLLLPGLLARLLQRPRGDGRRRPRLRGLPGRLHLRRDLHVTGDRQRRARRPHRPREPLPGRPARGDHADDYRAQVRSCTARTARCRRSRRPSPRSLPGTTTRSRTTTPAARTTAGCPPVSASAARASAPATAPSSRPRPTSRRAATGSTTASASDGPST